MGWQKKAERALLHACLTGQGDAWRRFFERFEAVLHDLASRELKRWQIQDPSCVDDVVSEVWCVLVACQYRALHAYTRRRSTVEGYLTIVTRSQVRRLYRGHQLAPQRTIPVDQIRNSFMQEPVSIPYLQQEALALLTAHEREFVEQYELSSAGQEHGAPLSPAARYKLRQRTRAKVQRAVVCF